MTKIYISSTLSDLNEYREAVISLLREEFNEDVTVRVSYTASSNPTLKECQDDVDWCDIYIGIFARRYGSKPPNRRRSYTHFEYLQAVKSKKECLIFLSRKDAPCAEISEDEAAVERIDNLRKTLEEEHKPALFSTPEDLEEQVRKAVFKIIKLKPNNLQKFEAIPPPIFKLFVAAMIIAALIFIVNMIIPDNNNNTITSTSTLASIISGVIILFSIFSLAVIVVVRTIFVESRAISREA
jgi:hypothetical protein